MSLLVAQRWRARGLRRALQGPSPEVTAARLAHPGPEPRSLLAAALVAAPGGAVPTALSVLTMANLVFPVPERSYLDVQALREWHWELACRARPWLWVDLGGVAIALVAAALLAVIALEAPARARRLLAPALSRDTGVPLGACLLVHALAVPLEASLVAHSLPLAREAARAVPWGCAWTPGEAAPWLDAPEGAGPNPLPEAPTLLHRPNGASIDGIDGTLAEAEAVLRNKRELWLAINPGRAHPGLLVLGAREEAPAEGVLKLLGAAQAAGNTRAALALRHCVTEDRPLLGRFTGCSWSSATIELSPTPIDDAERCGQESQCGSAYC